MGDLGGGMQQVQPWQIKLFGGLRAERGDTVLTRFRTQHTAALLGYLAFHLNQAHPREVLIDMLWQDADPTVGRHNLSMALSFLRGQLQTESDTPILLTTHQTVQLNPVLFVVDVHQFTTLLQQADTASETEPIELLSQTVNLYQGELLRGFYQDWILPQAVRLEEQFVRAVHRLMRLLEQGGQREQALAVGLNALTHIPLHEGTHLEVMRLQIALGQPENALRQYDYCRQLLQEQLGASPSDALRELAEQVRQPSPRVLPSPPAQSPATALELEAALDWTFAYAPERALLLVLALTPLWERQAHWVQAQRWLEQALAHPDLEPSTRAHLLMQMARFAFRLGAYGQAGQGAQQALLLLRKSGDMGSLAEAVYLQGRIAEAQCAYGRAATLYRQAHGQMQAAGDRRGSALVLSSLARLQTLRGRFEEAEEALQAALQLARACRDIERESIALHNLAFLRLWQARPELALYEQALALRQTVGDRVGTAAILNGMGRTYLELGEAERAVALCTESITIRRAIGDRPGLAHACCFLGRAHLQQDQLEQAQLLFDQSLSLCREFGSRPYEAMALEG
ncbi:MAG: tetratricopeptide repeat protein, partial [Fimbriimonadales bacterium]|nr:tetratricopeptide repeat protein [Fimbriimonadales bacterium]